MLKRRTSKILKFKIVDFMTKEEYERFKQDNPMCLNEIKTEDKYGLYGVGWFRYKGKDVLVTIDDGKWHLSVSCNHFLGYVEMKELRYKFLPNDMMVGQMFPPREEFVNVHKNCFHLWEV